MTNYISYMRHGLSSLANFRGKDTRTAYWSYALTVFGFCMAMIMAGNIFWVVFIFRDMQQFAQDNPDQAIVEQGPLIYSVELTPDAEYAPDFMPIITVMAILILALIILLPAATVRRLRDAGSSPLWLLPPALLLLTGLLAMAAIMNAFMQGADDDVSLFFLPLFANNLLYIISLGVLLFKLLKPSASKSHPL